MDSSSITPTIHIAEGIFGSTDFAKSRIFKEGGKTIEALFWSTLYSFITETRGPWKATPALIKAEEKGKIDWKSNAKNIRR